MPNRSVLCFTLFLLLSFPALAADQVVLTNGDTITGEIVKKDGDKLTVKSEFLGEVTMPWTAVAAIKSDSPLFVALPNGDQANGKLSTAGNDVEIDAPSGRQSTPLAGISAIRNQAEQDRYERLQHPG